MYNKTINDVVLELQTNKDNGLSLSQIQKIQEKDGLNELDKVKKTPLIVRFLYQFKDALILILLGAALVSIVIDPNEWIDSLVILIVVIINAVLGLVQEQRADKALEALKKLSSPSVNVIREGKSQLINANQLVVGDLVELRAGDLVAADIRIIEAINLKVDESSLTGESLPVEKHSTIIKKDDIPLGDRKNMAFSSTIILSGRGRGLVVATGMKSEVGKIAKMIAVKKEEATPLQNQLTNIGKLLGAICLIICVFVFGLELLSGLSLIDAFKTSITLAVAAIPEGLATIVTIVLAIGVQKMAKSNAIVKKLPAVETLGCASIICSDKTGTLTQNRMIATKIYLCGDDQIRLIDGNLPIELKKMLTYYELCSNTTVTIEDNVATVHGDSTEVALVEASRKYGYKSEYSATRIKELPFDSNRKMMSVIISVNNRNFVITKGAPDVLMKHCQSTNVNQVLLANERMASEALRVLGIAIKEIDQLPTFIQSSTIETDLVFLGLVGMIDPPKEGVKESIASAKKAGIRTIMITGDHITTAKAIAKDLNIIERGQGALTGDELNQMSDEELEHNVHHYSVYARVSPEHKMRIVEAWQRRNEIVAMTGDGVNDSPALRKADIGCAMGKSGSEVAKSVASIILTDDNYTTIVTAIKQGRGVYANIKKVIQFLLSSNIGEVLVIVIASLISLIGNKSIGVPLLPIHLLFVNLITDSFPAFALGFEPVDDNVMNQKPRAKNEGFFANHLGFTIAYQGIIIGLITIVSYLIGLNSNYQVGTTMAFVTLSVSQLFHAFNIKSSQSVFTKKLFNNKYLWFALIAGILFEILIINIPFFFNLFNLAPLSMLQIIVATGLAFMIVVLVEFVKEIKRIASKKQSETV